MSYVEVPSASILAFLAAHGFTERSMKVRGNEIVYERAHKVDSRYKVLVYTSVRRGATRARGLGKDAIRVCAIWEQGSDSRGLCKLPRVHRTGTVDAVLERMLARMREAYAKLCEARPKTRLPNHPRNPDGRINNCARNNRTAESECQICRGECPDARFFNRLEAGLPTLQEDLDTLQQKHHPGSRPHGVERVLGDHYPEDDLDPEDV